MFDHKFESELEIIGEKLDIPNFLFEEAVEKYEEVAEWLGAEDSEISEFKPIAYPQGSFRLGTVIKPTSNGDQYDVDFVCRLFVDKEKIGKEKLKELIGSRLRQHELYPSILQEKGRCWALNFSDTFHIDILPTIPDQDDTPSGILLADKDLHRWQKSNPIKYSDWFMSRMALEFEEKRRSFAKSRGIEIEEVNDWEVKGVLQRSIQILKRHRDIYFKNCPDKKPASIIISTLCGLVYDGKSTLQNALPYLIRNLTVPIKKNGLYIIESPVSDENFADKWNEDAKRAEAFKDWSAALCGDFIEAIEGKQTGILLELLGAGDFLSENLKKSEITTVPEVTDAPHCQPPEWNQRTIGTATIRAEVYRSTKKKKLHNMHSARVIPKSRWLKFTINTNVSEPYEVKWQVVNTGPEIGNDLRGEFCDSDFKNGKWERTKYRGTHWIEGFVIKDGVCVARSGKFYVKIRNSYF